jgi:quinol-cytochrome oxidoreductase complex cytochrome b subunit
MDADRLRTGELIAAVSAVALFIIMFLPWFGVGGVAGEALEQAQDLGFAGEVDTSANAWESFDFIDLVLLVTIVVAVGLAAATMAAQTVALPVAASAITAGLGILSTLLIIYRIIDPPGDADRKFWVFLGLIAAAGIAYGGWRAMQEEGTSFGGEADRVRGRGEPPPPPPPQPPSSQGPAA